MPVEQSSIKKTPIENTLSVCIIVKNEAALLERCLDSIKDAADELVVIDTGSTDNTVAIAQNKGAHVICTQWRDDFAWARNISIEHASGCWILWLDADDIVPASSIPLLNQLKFQKPDRILGFTVRNERPGNTGTEFVQARMFPNRKEIYFERRIHEQLMPSALRIGMKMDSIHEVVIEHHGYADPATMKKKALRNIKLLIADYNETDPDSVTTVEIADSYQLTEDYETAKSWYEKTLAIPNCETATPSIAGQAHLGLGNIYNLQENYELAINHLKKASSISPWRPDILYSLAVGLEQNNQTQEALGSLYTILSLQPKAGQVGVDFRSARIKANLRLLRLLVEQNRITEAAKVIADALQAQPDRPELHNAAGKFLIKCDRLIDALHSFEKSIMIVKEGNLDAFIGLSLIYIKAGYRQKAIDTIESLSTVFAENVKLSVFKSHIENSAIFQEQQATLTQLRREFFNVF